MNRADEICEQGTLEYFCTLQRRGIRKRFTEYGKERRLARHIIRSAHFFVFITQQRRVCTHQLLYCSLTFFRRSGFNRIQQCLCTFGYLFCHSPVFLFP